MHPPRLAPQPSPQEAGFPWKEPLRFSLPDFSNIDLANIDLTAGVNAVVSPCRTCSGNATMQLGHGTVLRLQGPDWALSALPKLPYRMLYASAVPPCSSTGWRRQGAGRRFCRGAQRDEGPAGGRRGGRRVGAAVQPGALLVCIQLSGSDS